MDLQGYIDEIKLQLTGDVLDLEIEDSTIAKILNAALREIQRYIDSTKLVTLPYKPCMDLTDCHVSSVSRVFRTEGYNVADSDIQNGPDAYADPMYMGMWQMMSGYGNTYNLNDWIHNFSAWNTSLQIRNTLSTDLAFKFDKQSNKLYINCAFDKPDKITLEYVPIFQDVSEIKSDFWIDMLTKVALAMTKIIIGRIRKKFSQSNALWTLDTDILQEGLDELNNLREQMRTSTQLTYGID